MRISGRIARRAITGFVLGLLMMLGMAGVASAQGYGGGGYGGGDGYGGGGTTCGYPGYPDCPTTTPPGTDNTGGNRPDTGSLANTGSDWTMPFALGGTLIAAVLVGRRLIAIRALS